MALTFGTLLSSQGTNAHHSRPSGRSRGNSPSLGGEPPDRQTFGSSGPPALDTTRRPRRRPCGCSRAGRQPALVFGAPGREETVRVRRLHVKLSRPGLANRSPTGLRPTAGLRPPDCQQPRPHRSPGLVAQAGPRCSTDVPCSGATDQPLPVRAQPVDRTAPAAPPRHPAPGRAAHSPVPRCEPARAADGPPRAARRPAERCSGTAPASSRQRTAAPGTQRTPAPAARYRGTLPPRPRRPAVAS